MLLNINPLKKMFEEIFFLFMKSEMRKIEPPPPIFFTSPFPLFHNWSQFKFLMEFATITTHLNTS